MKACSQEHTFIKGHEITRSAGGPYRRIACKGRFALPIGINPQNTGIPYEENDHDNGHGDRVKDIQSPLILKRIAAITQNIFNNPECRADNNQRAHGIQHIEKFLPRDDCLDRFGGGRATDPSLEHDSSQPEDREGDELDGKTSDDDDLGSDCVSQDRQGGRAALDEEGEHISPDERFGESGNFDDG